MRRVDLECPACQQLRADVYVQTGDAYPACVCGTPMVWCPSAGLTVRPDSIPGGLLIEHGLCNADGTPRRYDSRSEIARECQVRGLIPWTEVYTEDRTKDARVHDDWLKSGEATRARAQREDVRREKRARR